MAEIVPGDLQDKLNSAGFSFKQGSTSIRSNMEIGLDKVRQRFTTPINQIQGTVNIVKNDIATLQTWFDTTLAGGSKTFLYEDPFTGLDDEFRFIGEYGIVPLGGINFRVSFTWEYIP